MIETFIQFNQTHCHLGLLSVLMRQTNIIWVGMVLGCTVMDKLISQTMPFISERRSTVLYNYRVDNTIFISI